MSMADDDPFAKFSSGGAARPTSAAPTAPDADDPFAKFPSPSERRSAAAAQAPSTTAGGLAGSITRGFAPIATGAAVGGVVGGPPGAVAGAGAVGLTELATALYNPLAERFGWPKSVTPQEMTDRVLDVLGVKRPSTGLERIAETTAGGAAGAGSAALAAGEFAESAAGPVVRGVARKLAEAPVAQAVSGATGGAAGQMAAEAGAGPFGQSVASTIGGMLGATPTTLRRGPPAGYEDAALQNKARSAVSSAFERGVQGGAPSASDVIDEMTKARTQKQPLTLSDINNPELGGLIGTTYRQGGPARSTIKTFMTARQDAASSRVQGLINQHLSDQSLRDTSERLIAERSAHARPLWDKAASVGPIWSDRLGQLLAQPEIQAGIKRGYNIERRNAVGRNQPFNPSEYAVTSFNSAGDPVFDKVPTMRLMMAAKEGLDAIIDSPSMKNALTGKPTKSGLSYINLRDGLLSELDTLNPHYKAARDQWSGETSSIKALDDGRHFMDKGRFSLEELPSHYSSLSDNEKQFFVLGVADALKERLFGSADAANKGRIINNEATRMRIRPLFKTDEEASLFIDSIERERQMAQTPGRIYGGSPTGERVSDDKTAQALVHAAHGIGHLLHGNFLSSIASALHMKRLFGGKPNPELNREIARIVTDPNVQLQQRGPLLAPAHIPQRQSPPLAGAIPGMIGFGALPQDVTDPYASQIGVPP